MSSSRSLISYDRELSKEEDELLLKTAIRLSRRFEYCKLKTNLYECKCSICEHKENLSKHELDMVREAGVCLWCGNWIKTSPKRPTKARVREWIALPGNYEREGYSVTWWKENGEIKHISRHVAHFIGDVSYVKGIVKNFGSLIDSQFLDYWRKTRKSYGSYSSDYECYFERTDFGTFKSKREYYGFYADNMPTLKSNQLTFIKKGIYNMKQIAAIHMFDLNTADQVHKYKTLIKNNQFREPKLLPVLNPTYADYIQRNNYTISDFMDYFDMCRELGQKLEKPKDLYEAHQRQIEQKKVMEIEKHKAQVKERYCELVSHEGSDGAMEIKAFKNVNTVSKVASTLNNCIARIYLPRYCEKRLDLYYGLKEGKINFALEVRKGEVVQLRGKNNRDVDPDVAAFVKSWAKKQGFAFGV